jgi:hypothetical protein
MKLTASFSRIVAAFVALGVAAVFSAAQAAETGRVLVKGVSGGKASYSTDGKTFKPLKVGARLSEKAVVRTEDGAKVDMVVQQGNTYQSVVRAEQKTQLGFDSLQYEDIGENTVVENKFDLPEGQVVGNVAKIAAASKYEIATPNGVAGIRGTQYSVSSSGAVTVVSGRVSVTIARTITNAATGATQVVTVQVSVEAGQTFTPPPLTAEGTATLVQMATAQAQVQAATAAVAAAQASGNTQAAAAAQAQLATAQASFQTAQATAVQQAPPAVLVTVATSVGQATVITQVGVATGPTGPTVGTQVEVIVPEPEPVITVTGG